MKKKIIKFTSVVKMDKKYWGEAWKEFRKCYILRIEYLEGVLIISECNTGRQSDYKKALGFERFHNLSCGRLHHKKK